MRHRGHLSKTERTARSKLGKIIAGRRFLCGSLVHMNRVCGKASCKCTRGEKHPALCLAMRVGDKRKMVHVPASWEKTITTWVENYQQIKALMESISQECLQRFLREKEESSQKSQGNLKGKSR